MLPKDACMRDGLPALGSWGLQAEMLPRQAVSPFRGLASAYRMPCNLLLFVLLFEVAFPFLCSAPEAAPVLTLRQKSPLSAPRILFLSLQPSHTHCAQD